MTGTYDTTIAAADRALALAAPLAASSNATVIMLGALLDKSQALIYLGNEGAARVALEEMLPMAQASGKAHLEVTVLNRLHTLAKDRGDHGTARDYLEHALSVARASGHRRFEGALMSNLGGFESWLGHYDKARALIQAGLDISRGIGDRGSVPYAMHELAAIDLQQGEAARGVALLREARDLSREVSDRGCEADCNLLLGSGYAALGEAAQARAAFDDYEAWASNLAGGQAASPTMPKRAGLALAEGDVEAAQAIVERIIGWLATRDGPVLREDLDRYFVCHRVLDAAGDVRADAFLVQARELLMSQAATLEDADRKTYLEHVPLHRAIVAAWQARGMQSGLAA